MPWGVLLSFLYFTLPMFDKHKYLVHWSVVAHKHIKVKWNDEFKKPKIQYTLGGKMVGRLRKIDSLRVKGVSNSLWPLVLYVCMYVGGLFK